MEIQIEGNVELKLPSRYLPPSLPDPKGWPGSCPRSHSRSIFFFIFMQFSGKNEQIITFHIQLRSFWHPTMENPESATANPFLLVDLQKYPW